MLPSLDLTKTALALPSWRNPAVSMGGGALLGAGLGAGVGALTADTENGESRWNRAGIGAGLGGIAGMGAGAVAADWSGINPFEKLKSSKPKPTGPSPKAEEPKAVAPAPVVPAASAPVTVAPAPAAPLAPAAPTGPAAGDNLAYAVTHRNGNDIAHILRTEADGSHVMQSLATGEEFRVHPKADVIDAIGPVEHVSNDMAGGDQNHPYWRFIAGEDPEQMKQSEFWAAEYFKVAEQLMTPEQHAGAKRQFMVNDLAKGAPLVGGAAGALGGYALGNALAEKDENGKPKSRLAGGIGAALGAGAGALAGIAGQRALTKTPMLPMTRFG